MKKEVFNKLKTLLGIYSFKANAVLIDGTGIIVDAIDIGAQVFIPTSDGNQPLPDGEYKLEDGMTTIVVLDGVITDIITDTTETPEETEAPAPDVTAEEEPATEPVVEDDFKTQIGELNDRITKLEEALSSIMKSQDEMKEENEKLSKEKEEFSTQVEDLKMKLEKMDGATPIKKHETNNDKTDVKLSDLTLQRMKALGLHKK